MKTWIIPVVAASLLLASPTVFAASPDQNASSQQGQHKDKNAKGGGSQSGHNNTNKNGGGTNAGQSGNRTVNTNKNVNVNRNVYTNRKPTVDRNINKNTNVIRNVDITHHHNVDVHRTVRVNRHIDVRVYERNFNSPHRYHWQTYRRPSGWYHHRWGYGQHLPRAWFVRDYWIPNFIMFGLIAPPHGYVWVRVGDDALLVATETGEVIRVVYGLFY